MDFKEKIKNYYVTLKQVIDKLNIDELNDSMNAILDTYNRGGNIYICGNGGSASTASHFQNDFNKGISYNLDKKFNFICLNDNIATIMAIANDDGYEKVFSKQIENKINNNDLFIAISGSGNSKNVVTALDYCLSLKEKRPKIIGISGYKGGKLFEMADYHMHCPIENMQIDEDIHLTFCHMMMTLFSELLGGHKSC